MRNTWLWALLPVISAPVFAETHCLHNEDVVFSCSTGKKVVSLCSSQGMEGDAAYLQYRFGQIGHVEMVFPEHTAGSIQKFTIQKFTPTLEDGTKANIWEIAFSVNAFKYTLSYTRAKKQSGDLNVLDAQDKTIASFNCKEKSIFSDGLYNLSAL